MLAIVPGLHVQVAQLIDVGIAMFGEHLTSRWSDIVAGHGSII